MYETLLDEAQQEHIDVYEFPFRARIQGLYWDRAIGICRDATSAEKACILAEELGHYHTTVGDILDQEKPINRKLESRARRWGYERLLPLDKLISADRLGIHSPYELAESLGVTDSFLAATLQHYKSKHGTHFRVGDNWICFDPFRVCKCHSKK